jgi:hypothetical protein
LHVKPDRHPDKEAVEGERQALIVEVFGRALERSVDGIEAVGYRRSTPALQSQARTASFPPWV